MREAVLALGLFALLTVTAWTIQTTTAMTLMSAGAALVVGGLLFSVPCAVRYHWSLYRTLAARGALPRHWIWQPTALHDRLHPAERARVLPWFYAGAAGWAAMMVGCALVGLAAWWLR